MKMFIMMFKANVKEFVRDRSGLFWTFAFPVCFIMLFGIISSEESGLEIDFFLPGILALALLQLGIFGALQFLSLREKKIIRGLSLTPLSRMTLLSSEIVLRVLAGFVQSGIILSIAYFIFNIEFTGNLFLLILFITLGANTFIGLGYMLICFVNSIEGGTGLAQIVQLPMMFLSGIFIPTEMLPEFIRPISRIIPLTYLADSFREVMVGTPGYHSLGFNAFILLVFLGITLVITLKFWRWE